MLILTDINDGAIVLNILHLATPSSIIKETIFIQRVFHTTQGRCVQCTLVIGNIFGSEQSQSQVPSRLLIRGGRHLMKVQLRNMKIEEIGSL